MPEYKVLPAGDTALVIEFSDVIDRRTSYRVLELARRLNESRLEGIFETVPTFRSLLVHYDPLVLPGNLLVERIADLVEEQAETHQTGRCWRLPVCYEAQVAPDLDEVAGWAGLTPAQVVERHSGIAYHVYMIGFLPGQPYMGDVPMELALPRRRLPRPRIPAGSLAIASTMTCIFPLETPCGWHLIGCSPVPLWAAQPIPQVLLAPGDQVTFDPISLDEFEALRAKAIQGALTMMPERGLQGAAA
jgi:inhibitor of KinA